MLRADLFIGAQAVVWPQPLVEIYAGRKTTHWIWFVFPQLEGLGESENSKLFGLSPKDAQAYWRHDLLRERLQDACVALQHRNELTVEQIMGPLDAMKVRSSLTLFDWVESRQINSTFAQLLDERFDGQRCQRTLELLT
jgi:uncharacterized protein (DUF1810 family)